VPDPLTGAPVSEAQASRRIVAVMVDDLLPARPQSGFSAAGIVWQAPAEGGIPRYMMLFSAGDPTSVGPVRSSRQYYIEWASEWDALYVHVGGSPQALATLQSQGRGQLVWNADEFRWGGRYLWRAKDRAAPHNVYTDGKHLRSLVKATGAGNLSAPQAPVWRFAADAPLAQRPVGGSIAVPYPANKIGYRYDRLSNTYLRSVSGEKKQIDRGTGAQVAPKNVVILYMHFGPLNDSHPAKHRLEANDVGTGKALIATNGRTVKGTWRKASTTAPTLLYDGNGKPVTLTVGQTFVQVVPLGTVVTVKDGGPPPRAPVRPGPRPA
jgi:hypothetical protein